MRHQLIKTLLTLGLLVLAAPVDAEEVLLGLGYDRSRDGHGFDLHKLGEAYILYFYTYDDTGDPEWFLGVSSMDNGVLAGELQRYTYDDGADPASQRDGDFDGEFRLDFTMGFASAACNDGVNRNDAVQVSEFYWRIGDESSQWCTEFLPIGGDFNRSPYYGGVWYAGEADAGYGFTMTHMGNAVTALVYYYDADGQPRWALGAAGDDNASVELRHYEGFCRSCTPRPVRTSRAGTVALDWAPGTSPGRGDDEARLDLAYPEPPFGEFLRQFTLRRLSDGATRGEFSVDHVLPGAMQYVTAWQEDRGDGDKTEIAATTEFGVPLADLAVNVATANTQINPAVAIAANGSYVVTWEDDADGNGFFQIHARGFHADGRERIATFTVNSEGAGQQRYPDIAMAPNGDFVIVWEDDSDGNFFGQIHGRGFFADGRQKFADMTINAEGAGHQMEPAIGMDHDGNFVVAWSDDQDANEFYDIAVRGFNANGSQRFSQRRVNTQGAGQQWQPDVAVDANGNFVVVWTDDADLNQFTQVLGRGFTASGGERFGQRTLHQVGRASQYHPSIAMASNGRFAVSWVDQGVRIGGRGFYADGAAAYGDVYVNGDTLPLQANPSIGLAEDGSAVLVWSWLRPDGLFRLAGRSISPGGQAGAEFLVSTRPGSSQVIPALSVH